MWSMLIVGAVIVDGVGLYNSLVKLREQADVAWADIDVQLKRRTDLVPNIVATVKGYASHEKDTLEAVISARSSAMSAQGPGRARAGGGHALRRSRVDFRSVRSVPGPQGGRELPKDPGNTGQP
jgi:hypothetical protein